MLADSVLGATVQGKYECPACDARFERGNTVCHEAVRLTRGWRWLDNDAVNLAATLVGAAVAGLGSGYWREAPPARGPPRRPAAGGVLVGPGLPGGGVGGGAPGAPR